jgi:hypothetical protein
MFVVRVLNKSAEPMFKTFERCNDAIAYAMGPAFKEFDGNTIRSELYEVPAQGDDAINAVIAGTAKLLGVQDPRRNLTEQYEKLGGARGGGYSS